MYPNQHDINRVEAAIATVESRKGGAVHPIRGVPIDMVAEAVFLHVGAAPNDRDILASLEAVMARYDGHPTTSITR